MAAVTLPLPCKRCNAFLRGVNDAPNSVNWLTGHTVEFKPVSLCYTFPFSCLLFALPPCSCLFLVLIAFVLTSLSILNISFHSYLFCSFSRSRSLLSSFALPSLSFLPDIRRGGGEGSGGGAERKRRAEEERSSLTFPLPSLFLSFLFFLALSISLSPPLFQIIPQHVNEQSSFHIRWSSDNHLDAHLLP